MHRFYLLIVLQALAVCLALQVKDEQVNKTNNDSPVGSVFQQIEIAQNIIPTNVLIEMSKSRNLEHFQEYIHHLKTKGVEVIKHTSLIIEQEIKPDKNFTKEVESTIDIYEKKLENYASENYITLLKSKHFVDDVYMFLDVLNTAYRYLLRQERKHFQDLAPKVNISNNNNSTRDSVFDVYRIIFRQSLHFKKEELLYICNNHQICKPYSDFILNLYTFLSEIHLLQDFELKNFVELLGEIITNDEDFLALINLNDDILKNLNAVFLNLATVKESLEVLRALLIHRYKIIHIPNLNRKRKVQAVRIMLDTLEKVLCLDHDKEIATNIDVVINAVKKWNRAAIIYDTDEESSADISDYINGIFKALLKSGDYFLPFLIDTILTGKLRELEDYKDLFVEGSKNVYSAEETF